MANRIMRNFSTPEDYWIFLEDYQEQKVMLDELKHELADQ
jgi:hypothetical protein